VRAKPEKHKTPLGKKGQIDLVTRAAMRNLDEKTRRDFGNHLLRLMEKAEVNQSELAKRCFDTTVDSRGLTVSKGRDRISKYTRGIAFPDNATLAKLAKALNVTLQELVPPSVRTVMTAQRETFRVDFDCGIAGCGTVEINRMMTLEAIERIRRIIHEDDLKVDQLRELAARAEERKR